MIGPESTHSGRNPTGSLLVGSCVQTVSTLDNTLPYGNSERDSSRAKSLKQPRKRCFGTPLHRSTSSLSKLSLILKAVDISPF